MLLEFLAWNSPPLDFSRITGMLILINITIIIILNNNNNIDSNNYNNSTIIIVRLR